MLTTNTRLHRAELEDMFAAEERKTQRSKASAASAYEQPLQHASRRGVMASSYFDDKELKPILSSTVRYSNKQQSESANNILPKWEPPPSAKRVGFVIEPTIETKSYGQGNEKKGTFSLHNQCSSTVSSLKTRLSFEEQLHGRESPEYLGTLVSLADACIYESPSEALQTYQQVVEFHTSAGLTASVEAALVACKLARARSSLGDNVTAIYELYEYFEMVQASSQDPSCACICLSTLSYLTRRQRDTDKATSLLMEASTLTNAIGDSPAGHTAIGCLAHEMVTTGVLLDEAIPLLQRIINVMDAPTDHRRKWRRAVAMFDLAYCLRRTPPEAHHIPYIREYGDRIWLLSTAIKLTSELFGSDDHRLQPMLQELDGGELQYELDKKFLRQQCCNLEETHRAQDPEYIDPNLIPTGIRGVWSAKKGRTARSESPVSQYSESDDGVYRTLGSPGIFHLKAREEYTGYARLGRPNLPTPPKPITRKKVVKVGHAPPTTGYYQKQRHSCSLSPVPEVDHDYTPVPPARPSRTADQDRSRSDIYESIPTPASKTAGGEPFVYTQNAPMAKERKPLSEETIGTEYEIPANVIATQNAGAGRPMSDKTSSKEEPNGSISDQKLSEADSKRNAKFKASPSDPLLDPDYNPSKVAQIIQEALAKLATPSPSDTSTSTDSKCAHESPSLFVPPKAEGYVTIQRPSRSDGYDYQPIATLQEHGFRSPYANIGVDKSTPFPHKSVMYEVPKIYEDSFHTCGTVVSS